MSLKFHKNPVTIGERVRVILSRVSSPNKNCSDAFDLLIPTLQSVLAAKVRRHEIEFIFKNEFPRFIVRKKCR
jgi:hypothetical protein